MPLKKLTLKAGINRENTRYTNENGWYESQWVRFRQGTPEKIGGYVPLLDETGYVVGGQQAPGICRLIGITDKDNGIMSYGNKGVYYAPLDAGPYPTYTPVLTPFTSAISTATLHAVDALTTAFQADFTVTVADTTALAQYVQAYSAAYSPATTYPQWVAFNIIAPTVWPDDAPGGGLGVPYQIKNIGPSTYGPGYIDITITGYGNVTAGSSPGGVSIINVVYPSTSDTPPVTLSTDYATGFSLSWSASNFGTTVVFNQRGGPIWTWDSVSLALSSTVFSGGLTAAPLFADIVLVSDVSRFVFAFGTTENLTPSAPTTFNPMLIRWSDQESLVDWEPMATNQAGSVQLSRGSRIIAVQQARQEILVWTDAALYSLQYVGAPAVWSAQLVGENISIAGQNTVSYANGTAYWMGQGKFYRYNGTVQTLRCDVRKYLFERLNADYYQQVCSSTNEDFNEVWWWYVSNENTNSNMWPDRYVVYNYLEDIWYYGTDAASAATDVRVRKSTGPIKAIPFDTPEVLPYNGPYSVLFNTEYLNDAYYNGQGDIAGAVEIPASITSAEFDLDDGHQFMFVWRMLPDITFAGSDALAPSVKFALLPMKNSGSGVTNPPSVGGSNEATVESLGLEPTYTIEEFTGQVFTRVRARQIMIQIYSEDLGVAWQVGSPRLDMRQDGRR